MQNLGHSHLVASNLQNIGGIYPDRRQDAERRLPVDVEQAVVGISKAEFFETRLQTYTVLKELISRLMLGRVPFSDSPQNVIKYAMEIGEKRKSAEASLQDAQHALGVANTSCPPVMAFVAETQVNEASNVLKQLPPALSIELFFNVLSKIFKAQISTAAPLRKMVQGSILFGRE